MTLRAFLAGAAAAMMLAPTASALSCMRPDIAQTMEAAKASDDIYYILVGTFTSAPPPKPQKVTTPNKTNKDGSPTIQMLPSMTDPNAPLNGIGAHNVQAWFDGRILSNVAQYDRAVSRMPIDVAVSCSGPWCGNAPANGQDVIAFVKARPSQAMLLEAGPCPNKVHRADEVQIAKLRSCFDKKCVSDADTQFHAR